MHLSLAKIIFYNSTQLIVVAGVTVQGLRNQWLVDGVRNGISSAGGFLGLLVNPREREKPNLESKGHCLLDAGF